MFAYRGIYAIIDDRIHADYGVTRLLNDIVKKSKISVIQIRAKNSSIKDIQNLAAFANELKSIRPFCLIVNDHAEAAVWPGVDGVHLGQTDFATGDSSLALGMPQNFVLGISARTPEAITHAAQSGASYAGVGAVFPTLSKGAPVIGLPRLRELVCVSALPVVAIGGITRENISTVAQSGCAMAAVLSGLIEDGQFVGEELHDAFFK